MENTERAAFAELLASVHALYRVEVTPGVAEIWWQALQQHDITALRAAFNRHAMNPDQGQFCPKPADIVREMGGTTQDKSMLAWAKVMGALKRHGTYNSVKFDDPIIHRVLTDLGGWICLGQQLEKEIPFIEKRFRDAYRAWLHRGQLGEEIPHLAGLVEAHNGAHGWQAKIPAPKLIGEQREVARLEG